MPRIPSIALCRQGLHLQALGGGQLGAKALNSQQAYLAFQVQFCMVTGLLSTRLAPPPQTPPEGWAQIPQMPVEPIVVWYKIPLAHACGDDMTNFMLLRFRPRYVWQQRRNTPWGLFCMIIFLFEQVFVCARQTMVFARFFIKRDKTKSKASNAHTPPYINDYTHDFFCRSCLASGSLE